MTSAKICGFCGIFGVKSEGERGKLEVEKVMSYRENDFCILANSAGFLQWKVESNR